MSQLPLPLLLRTSAKLVQTFPRVAGPACAATRADRTGDQRGTVQRRRRRRAPRRPARSSPVCRRGRARPPPRVPRRVPLRRAFASQRRSPSNPDATGATLNNSAALVTSPFTAEAAANARFIPPSPNTSTDAPSTEASRSAMRRARNAELGTAKAAPKHASTAANTASWAKNRCSPAGFPTSYRAW